VLNNAVLNRGAG